MTRSHLPIMPPLPDQPDDANWMSTALWRIRQEQYRRGAGYAFTPNPVETDFAPLLTLYPSSLAASAVRYSIGLERASEGAHSEAGALLEDVIRAISEAGGIEVTCEFRANVFFFAAREANFRGRREQAKEYLAQAQEAAEPACQRGNTCLSSTNPEIPVIAAMGVNYAFTRCEGGPGWVFGNFTFGLDRAGQVFEFGQVWWQSISPDMRSLAEEWAEHAHPVSTSPPIEQIIALIDQRAFETRRDPQRDAVLNERAGSQSCA
jgi:hypothetical protein